MSRVDRAKTSFQVTWQDPVPAPITKGQQVGVLSLTRDDKVVETIPLLAGNSVSELGLLDRVGAALKYIILGASNTSAGSTSGSQ